MGRTIIACLQLFRSIRFRADLPCLPQGGRTAYLLHVKQSAFSSAPIRSLKLLIGCAKISILVRTISLDFERSTAKHKIVREILKHTVTETR